MNQRNHIFIDTFISLNLYFQKLINVYKIEEPLIPTRDQTIPPAKKPDNKSKLQNGSTSRGKVKK